MQWVGESARVGSDNAVGNFNKSGNVFPLELGLHLHIFRYVWRSIFFIRNILVPNDGISLNFSASSVRNKSLESRVKTITCASYLRCAAGPPNSYLSEFWANFRCLPMLLWHERIAEVMLYWINFHVEADVPIREVFFFRILNALRTCCATPKTHTANYPDWVMKYAKQLRIFFIK